MEPREFRYEVAPPVRGATDRILEIDLSKMSAKVRKVSPEERELYIGGRGYCLWLVWEGTKPGTKWNDPENVVVMAGGMLGGETGWPGTGKSIVGTISPLTGSFVDSAAGGHFSPLLKLAGFDAVSVTGKAKQPVVVLVDGDAGKVRFEPHEGPDGAITMCEGLLPRLGGDGELHDIAAATVGPGARHSYHGTINSVCFDRDRDRLRCRQAGRGGSGTVMRDKNLMAIVAKSARPRTAAVAAADPATVREKGKEINEVIRMVDPVSLQLNRWGTTVLVELMDRFDLLPTHNYQTGHHEKAPQIFSGVWAEGHFSHGLRDGCYPDCTLECAKGTEGFTLRTGPHAGKVVGVDGPEYETAATGPVLGIFEPDYILEYAWYCDEYGLDTISAGITMGFLFEAYDRGYLTKEDTGGLELRWGDPDVALRLLHLMASGKGFGAVAGKGIRQSRGWIARRWAKRTGRKAKEADDALREFGMECKGLEFSVYVTKESLVQQGGYGFALEGPQHDESWLIFLDQVNDEMPTFEQKAKALRWFPLFRTWFDAMGLCELPWIVVRHPDAKSTPDPARNMPTIEMYAAYAGAVRGREMTPDDLLAEGERLYTIQKLFNLRQGLGIREHDRIPMRAMGPVFADEYARYAERYDKEVAAADGADALAKMGAEERLRRVQGLRRERYWRLADAVYEERGWDHDGVPKPELLARVGLTDPMFTRVADAARKRSEQA